MQNALVCLCTDSHDAEQRQRRQEAGEHEQQQADAVDADEVADAERRNPRVALDELEVGRRGLKRLQSSSVSANTSSDTTSAIVADQRRRSARRRRGRTAAGGRRRSAARRATSESERHRISARGSSRESDTTPREQRRGVGAHRPGLQPPQHARSRRRRSRRRRSPRRRSAARRRPSTGPLPTRSGSAGRSAAS